MEKVSKNEKEPNILLTSFDENFFNSVDDHELMHYDVDGTFHTIELDGEKIGVVGFLPSVKSSDEGFVQVVISKSFRGRGLAGKAEDELARQYNLKHLFATIKRDNISSIKSHLANGFVEVNDERSTELKKLGKLQEDEIRLVKEF